MPNPEYTLGNEFWKIRSRVGPPLLFGDAELLTQAAFEYFEWVDTHPLYRYELLRGGEMAGQVVAVRMARPYTLAGFCLYCGVTTNYFHQMRQDAMQKDDKEMSNAMKMIDQTILTQKFEGAASGIFNANFIARDLGMADRTDMTTKGQNINQPNITINMPTQLNITLPSNTDGEVDDMPNALPAVMRVIEDTNAKQLLDDRPGQDSGD